MFFKAVQPKGTERWVKNLRETILYSDPFVPVPKQEQQQKPQKGRGSVIRGRFRSGTRESLAEEKKHDRESSSGFLKKYSSLIIGKK